VDRLYALDGGESIRPANSHAFAHCHASLDTSRSRYVRSAELSMSVESLTCVLQKPLVRKDMPNQATFLQTQPIQMLNSRGLSQSRSGG